jgi:phosphatidylglycerol:prolipoprotein diacylglycerol transferase
MHLYGLIIGIAIVIGLNYFEKHNQQIPKSELTFFEIGVVIFAIVGARLYHVADQWQFYSKNPTLILQTWNGGMGIFGGIVASLIFILLYSKLKKKSVLAIIDQVTPILPLCQAIGRLGNYVNGEIPTWWVEAIGNLILFFIIKFWPLNPTGKYLIGYGLIRFATEFWRTDTWQTGSVKVGQVISIIFVLAGVLLICYEKYRLPINHSKKHLLDS